MEEVRDASREPGMCSHYVAHYAGLARAAIGKGNVERAEAIRIELLTRLNGLDKKPRDERLEKCIGLLEKTDWSSNEGVDNFMGEDEKIDAEGQRMTEVLRRLKAGEDPDKIAADYK